TPWPTSPDGEGTSLEKLSANGNNSASNWFASYNVGGTPCGQNSVSVGISAGSHSPWTPAPGGIVTFKVNATDLTGTITSVSVDISTDGFATKTTTSLTDSDSDGMWTGTFTTSSVEGTNYTYSFNTQNSNSGTGTLRNIFMNFTTMTFQPYISAFHAQGSSTDSDSTFVVITNPYGAVEDLDISWWYITDEGLATSFDGTFGNFASVWQFPANSFLAPGQSAFIAENGTQFEKDYGMVADYEMNGTSSASSMIKVLGGGSEFDLFEGGDEILLISSNAVIDAIKYSNFEPTSFDGDDFLSVSSSVQATDKFSRADSDTDDPANDFVQSTFPFVSLTNTTNGTTHVAGEVLSVASIDADGINSTMYNWDGGANATHSGSVAMPSAAGAHTLKLWANDSSGNWAYVTYVLTTGTPTAPVSTVPTTTTTTTTETTPTTTGTTTAVTTTATTTTTPAGTTTTPAATTSSTEDTDDGGFVPGFEIWVVLMSFSTLVAVRFRRKK
ncbi:MAG: hypothetical protein IH840_16815, partial [Candidatus Heimdallarchaeota archaeon]|nr:hypothetical protein [Candidatus Heimdallarchaeota archaeon]